MPLSDSSLVAMPIIIGAGPAGMRIARQLARYGNVLVLDGDTESPWATEARPQLLTQFQNARAQAGVHASLAVPLAPRIRLLSGRKVVHVDRRRCRVLDDSGQVHKYSQLFMAPGALPIRPELPGSWLGGVQTLYTRRQLDNLLNSLVPNTELLIVGGGLIAVELATLMAKRAVVTLIVRSRLLRRYVDPKLGKRVAGRLEKLGIRILEEAIPKRLLGRHDVTGAELADGRQLAAGRVVLACGSLPDTTLARDAGLRVDQGVLVDSSMRSLSDARVFAVGDCAQPPWPVMRGNIAQVLHMADLAVAAIRNEPLPSPPEGQYRECRLDDGFRLVVAASHQSIESGALHSHHYRYAGRVVSVTRQHRSIVAFQALLPYVQARRLTELWQGRIELSRWEWGSLQRFVWLPPRRQPDPLVCHCASVRLSAIHAAIAEYGSNPAMVCQATRAGYYCGSCLDDITTLCGNSSWWNRAARWSTVAVILLVVALLGLLPAWSVPDSVLATDFTAYRLMTDSSTREISGYLLTVVVLMTLAIRGDRRRYWWHVCLGSTALLLLPLHSLGGLASGSGFSAGLIGLMLLAALSGALLIVRRRLMWLRSGHLAVTLVLLTATLMHVVFIYQY
ncbi:FAD-dependent oxidoreductase [Marinobacter piscensis]|uniref:FAD-dependent oxidoreductase n=1 Tax=Marinobacter piscensis TaxID=1562308 RepID=UPI0011A53D41|nr:FAD-dependent oxidoreductase [Marinobacter piscensis]